MGSWFTRRSIRTTIVLLVLSILVPAAGMLAWVLARDLRHARDEAHAKVQILASGTAADVQAVLHRAEATLARLAERPLVKALDPKHCDPTIAEFAQFNPEFKTLGIRDLHGRIVCAYVPDPIVQLNLPEFPWFEETLRSGKFNVGNAIVRHRNGKWMVVLSYPIRNDAGAVVGVLALPVDLLSLNRQLMASVPANAVVSVVDRERTLLLRSSGIESFIGRRPDPKEADPLGGQREGFFSVTGRDGVLRLIAVATLPGVDWRVVAGLPEDEVFAEYRAALRRMVGFGLALGLLALGLAWRLSGAIVRPVAELARTAAHVAGGDSTARARVTGPPEIESVAHQFNRMLDARLANEAALRESEARYRALLDSSPEAISVHRDGKVVYVNQTSVEMLGGKSAKDLLGRNSLDFVHPDFHRAALDAADQVSGQGRAVPMLTEKFLTLDGRAIDVEVQGHPITYEGEPAVFASMRDVTQRLRTESALQLSEARLHGIIASATDAILTADATQTIVMANPAAAQMFGHPSGALVGMPLERLIPARYHATHRGDVQAFGDNEVAARHMGRVRDVMGVRANGEEFPVDAAISHLNTGGQRLYTVILRDITERRRAEDALRDSEARLRRLLTLLPEPVFVNTDDRISFVNEAAQHLFGLGEAALLGRSPLDVIHPDSRQLVRSRIAAIRTGTLAVPLAELKILRADGETRLVETVGTLIDDNGDASILVVLRDVTEYREAQSELVRSHLALQSLIAAQEHVQEEERKRIARELHDDLQQTLAAIRIDVVAIGGRLQVDRDRVAPMLAEVDALASAAVASTRRIVNDLRPQSLEDLGLVPALENLLGQFSQRTGVACEFDADGNTAEALMASPAVTTCLYRVTQEALNNVAKHAQASAVQVRLATAAGGRVWLRIHDNGRGMSTAERHRPQSFGLLGMHERVRALGGVVRVDSQPGAGATLEVLIPLMGDRGVPQGPSAGADTGAAALTHSASAAGRADAQLQAVIDALEEHVAVLDRQGVIRLVNRPWREFAAGNGDPELRGCGPGVNYLEVCRSSAAADELAGAILEGLSAVMAGSLAAYVIEYPCHSEHEERWFRMHAAPMADGRVLVTHFRLTRPAEST